MATIPFWPYRLFFLYIEPATALLGAFFAARPAEYLALCIPHNTYTKPLLTNPPVEVDIALYQLSNIFLFVALNEHVVLSSTDSMKTWRALLGCLLIADIGHLLTNLPLGVSVLWKVNEWKPDTYGTIGFVCLCAIMRIAFLSGLGLRGELVKNKSKAKAN